MTWQPVRHNGAIPRSMWSISGGRSLYPQLGIPAIPLATHRPERTSGLFLKFPFISVKVLPFVFKAAVLFVLASKLSTRGQGDIVDSVENRIEVLK